MSVINEYGSFFWKITLENFYLEDWERVEGWH